MRKASQSVGFTCFEIRHYHFNYEDDIMRKRINTNSNGGRNYAINNTGDLSGEFDSINVVQNDDVIVRTGRSSWKAKCLKCSTVFDSFNELEVHMFYKHKLAVCPICYTTDNAHKVYRHLVSTGNHECNSGFHYFREDEF